MIQKKKHLIEPCYPILVVKKNYLTYNPLPEASFLEQMKISHSWSWSLFKTEKIPSVLLVGRNCDLDPPHGEVGELSWALSPKVAVGPP